MQNAGALAYGNGGLIGQAAVVPLAVPEIGDVAHVGLDVAKSQIAPVNIFSFHCKHLSGILGNTAQFGKKSQAGFLFQFKVPKMEEYCMYFPFSELRKWDKKTAETRRRNCAVCLCFPNSSTVRGVSQAFGVEKSISHRDICLFQRNAQKPPLPSPFFLRKTPKGTCIQYGKVVKYRKAPQKKGIRVMDLVRHPGEDLFFEAILSLRTVEDCRLFFEDVATIKELQAMSQRFRVACLLDGGENYIEVSESTGASSATISRVNRCLVYGGGYRTALDRLKESGVLPEGEEK